MNYIISYDIAGLVIILVLFFIYSHENLFPSRTNRIFIRLMIFSILAISFDLITVYTNATFSSSLIWLNNLLAVIHILITNILPVMYFAFIISITHNKKRFTKIHYAILLCPLIFDFLAITFSPFTHFVMYYNSNNQYQHGIGMKILYLINAIFIILSTIEIIRHNKSLTKFHIYCILGYSVLIITASCIQMLNPQILLNGFAISLAGFIISFTLRNPLEFLDQEMGLYNLSAFHEFYFSRYDLQRKCSIGIIHLTNYDNLQSIYSTETTNYFLSQIWDNIKHELAIKQIFYISKNCFLTIAKNKETVYKQLDYIHSLPVSSVRINSYSDTRENIKIETDVFILEDFSLSKINTSNTLSHPINKLVSIILFISQKITPSENIRIINDDIFTQYEETLHIRSCTNRAIADNAFEVYLQPIYNVYEKKFTAAESLLRLKDDSGKFIPPSLFIPEAEESGRIFDIGDISIRKTCEFIKQGKVKELGIQKVNINLSVNQCMHDDIAEHLLSLINEYNIPKDMLCFEITETTMSKNPETLLKLINTLSEKGICFALDDYGTGYSNTSRLLSFPFSEIKFDKSLIDAASVNKQNADCIKYMFAMVKSSNRLALAEGVETKEMSDMMEAFGCDLIQGYYYSKPLPLPQFVENVAKVNQPDVNL